MNVRAIVDVRLTDTEHQNETGEFATSVYYRGVICNICIE